MSLDVSLDVKQDDYHLHKHGGDIGEGDGCDSIRADEQGVSQKPNALFSEGRTHQRDIVLFEDHVCTQEGVGWRNHDDERKQLRIEKTDLIRLGDHVGADEVNGKIDAPVQYRTAHQGEGDEPHQRAIVSQLSTLREVDGDRPSDRLDDCGGLVGYALGDHEERQLGSPKCEIHKQLNAGCEEITPEPHERDDHGMAAKPFVYPGVRQSPDRETVVSDIADGPAT